MIYQLEYVHYPRAYVNVTKTLAEDLVRAISRANHWKELFSSGVITRAMIGDLECIYGNSPDLLLPRLLPCGTRFDRSSFSHQPNICFKSGNGRNEKEEELGVARSVDSIEDTIRKISRQNCHQQINRSLLLVHVDIDYGSVICSNIVSWIFFFFCFLNNGLLFLGDLELVVIILDLFIRSFYCLVCCVGWSARLGIALYF